MANERITVRVRGGIESGTVVWRKPGKVRVALRTGKVRTFDESAEWKPIAHNLDEATRREMFPRVYAKRDAEAAAKAFEPVTIGTSSQGVVWTACVVLAAGDRKVEVVVNLVTRTGRVMSDERTVAA